MDEKIIIFDTTLRDGEQSPGASMNTNEKIEVARQLAKLNVDVIEAGFPASSPGDLSAVKLIAEEIEGPVIAGLARAKEADIEACQKALVNAKKKRIHTFIPSSDVQIKYQLKSDYKSVIKATEKAVRMSKDFTQDVEFSAMDATRSNREFLFELLFVAIECGATTVNVPDTVGYIMPVEFGILIKDIFVNVKNISKAMVSVHCHNDLGLATANSLSAVRAGARQVECTVNGLGERAGNASVEEIVMTIRTRKDFYEVATSINTKEIYRTSRLVSKLTGIAVQRNKAIVGQNAFAHESGIHQDGILKERTTYEIMKASDIGLKESSLVLGKHSGRHAFSKKLKDMGYNLNDEQLNHAFEKFKGLADKKKDIYDEDLETIAGYEIGIVKEKYVLEYFHTTSGNQTVPTATVKLVAGDKTVQEAATGDGPVDASYNAIDRIVGIEPELVDYSLKAITGGKDALGEVRVAIKVGDLTVSGRGASTDIIEASIKAYLNAVNIYISKRENNRKS